MDLFFVMTAAGPKKSYVADPNSTLFGSRFTPFWSQLTDKYPAAAAASKMGRSRGWREKPKSIPAVIAAAVKLSNAHEHQFSSAR